MILLLAHKRIIRIAKIESFVRVHPVMWHRQLFEIMIAENVPGCLLKRMKPNALVTGIDVTVVSDLVAIQHRATAAATVLHGTQFRFLKKKKLLQIIQIKTKIYPISKTLKYLFDVDKAILAKLPLFRSRL